MPMNLLEEIDSASRIHTLKREDIDALMIEFAQRITAALHIERMSVWLFNEHRDAIVSMGEYDTRGKKFTKGTVLFAKDYPAYFRAMETNKILLAPDIMNDDKTKEFNNSYSRPNNIVSLMDIPLRMMGELVGVMCFEKCGKVQRVFSEKEQTFAFSLSLVFASNLEARHRRIVQTQLEESIKEKEMLIAEINHRVKNNFSILISLLRLSKLQGKTSDPETILEEYEQRIFSMMKIHDLLYRTKNYTSINLSHYLNELIREFRSSHPGVKVNEKLDDSDFFLVSRSAIRLGLVVTEIFLNYVKHVHLENKNSALVIELKKEKNNLHILRAGQEGEGFDFHSKLKNGTLGLPLIKDMAEDFCEKVTYPDEKNGVYVFEMKD